MPLGVSVLICTRDRSEMLDACLSSVLACSPAPAEVVVVDQSRDESTRQTVCRHQGGPVPVRYLRGRGVGLSRAKNQGIGDCSAAIIAFTDDDCRVDPSWVEALTEPLRLSDASAAVGKTLPETSSADTEETFSTYAPGGSPAFTRRTHPWRVGGGGNFAARRDALRETGPYDERFGPGALLESAEDMDMVHRLLRSGRRIVYAPAAVVWHRSWRSRAAHRRLSRAYGIGAGAYFTKYFLGGDLLSGWRFLARFGIRTVHLALAGLHRDRRRMAEQSVYLLALFEGAARYLQRWILSLPVSTVAASLVVGAAAVFLATALFGLFNPRDTSQPEGAVVAAALRVAHGEPLYLDVRKGPYVTAMYGPLLYLLLGGAARLASAGVEGAYLAGRLLALLSAIACALLVAHLSRRSGASPLASRIAGGLFLASPLIVPVAYSARSDVPAVALALAGIALFDRWADSPMRFWAAVPLVAAAFTKQTALAATLAIALSLLLIRRPGRAVAFGSVVALPCAAILALLIRSTHGLAALNLLEVPGASPLSPVSRPLGGLVNFLALAALPLILAAPALPRLAAGEAKLRLPLCYGGVALLVSLAASTKLGSDSYYFLEPLAATLILSGVGLTVLLQGERTTLAHRSGALLAGVFAVLLAGSVGWIVRVGEYRYRPNDQVIRLAASAPGDVLIEDENVALKCGKPVTMMDPFAFAYLHRRGRWDPEPLNRRIRERRFGVIILRSPIEHPSHYQGETYWTEETLAAIGRAYEPEGTVDGFVVYRPRSESSALARDGGRS